MRGRLEVITGPMFSGKTEELIDRLRVAQGMGRMVRVYKPKIDGRYSNDAIVSHKGTRFDAVAIPTPDFQSRHEVIGIDEVQFFGEPVIDAIMLLVKRGTRVITSGLDLTFKGEPFEPMPQLLALADNVRKLHARCAKCGEDANRSQRIVSSNAAILVGGPEAYEPRCFSCFISAGGPD